MVNSGNVMYSSVNMTQRETTATSQELLNSLFRVCPSRLYVLELCEGTLTDYCSTKYEGQKTNEVDGLLQMARGLTYIHSKTWFTVTLNLTTFSSFTLLIWIHLSFSK